ncbi:MAG TPA: glycosyltransferase family 1 protein [Henriciella sp.]|nr:glycosyltransferase family 1 protein [Henriciella sp.]
MHAHHSHELLKLAYVVTEAGCMDPTTGARQHINMGLRELGKHTEVIRFLPPHPKKVVASSPRCAPTTGFLGWVKTTGLWGAGRDLRDALYNFREAWRLVKEIENCGCHLAYVRVHALHPLPIFLKCRGISVFLEANGLQFASRKARFRSWLSWLYRPFERYTYRNADHVFFVGSYGQFWQLSEDNWTEVENGIEPELIQPRSSRIATGNRLRVVLLARLMAHHKGHILPAAITRLPPRIKERLEIHLVGSGLEQLERDLAPLCHVENHGFVSREEIGKLLKRMDCGLIPDCPAYGSQMKLLDYAASGCLVLAPEVFHLKQFFDGKGVFFFKRRDPANLAERLEAIMMGDQSTDAMARALQTHVQQQYTWSAIFDRKWEIISELMPASK